MPEPINTHNEFVKFGKHIGERWTRVPIGYLKWAVNNMLPEHEGYKFAKAEIERRGDTMPKGVRVSNHAIDKASLRVRKCWHTDRKNDEGLYSWLTRICTEVLDTLEDEPMKPERVKYKGCVLVFEYGNYSPTLKTVMNDKSYKLPEGETHHDRDI